MERLIFFIVFSTANIFSDDRGTFFGNEKRED